MKIGLGLWFNRSMNAQENSQTPVKNEINNVTANRKERVQGKHIVNIIPFFNQLCTHIEGNDKGRRQHQQHFIGKPKNVK